MSTTDRVTERGQILVLFAGGLVALFIVAALAFDVGSMYLERRDGQNSADAAALAGARYVLGAPGFHGTCAGGGGGNPAATAACEVAVANDDLAAEVTVHIPPVNGLFATLPGHIEVDIASQVDGIFGGIVGRAVWPVGVMGVAANQPGITYPFGMLALNPTGCKAILISGSGTVNANSNVQSNSTGADCGDGSNIGFSRTGGGVLNVTAPDAVCRSAGALQDQGSGDLNCTAEEFSFSLPDPLVGLPAPAKPALAAPMKEVVGSTVVAAPTTIPDDCPGATGTKAPSEANPKTCVLGQGGAQANRKWILSPGLYPGGLVVKGGVTAFLLPGIYWIGGGGIDGTAGSMISIATETNRTPATCDDTLLTWPCTGGGGILIYNTKLPNFAAGPIKLGGNGLSLNLQPYDYPFGDETIKLVFFQDRTVNLGGDDITLNGSNSEASLVRGIVYVPIGDVKVNGASSTFSMDQVIAWTFQINGNGGTVNVLRKTGVDAVISAVGLVE